MGPAQRRSTAPGYAVDFDAGAAGQRDDPDTGPRRQPARREIGPVDLVHARELRGELGEEDAHADEARKVRSAGLERGPQIVDGEARLSLDVGRQRRAMI